MNSIIKLKNVSKFYYRKGMIATGFSRVNLEFNIGEFVAITGESGSGKSTLLNVISGLDTYEEGEMYINGEETSHYVEKDFEDYRRKYIGNIFQNFNLVNSYTVYQNIELVLLLNGSKKKEIKKKVIDLIKKVDLYKFRNTKVSKLSGGQKQRVAIARALAKDTPIIIADEPTGNLDSASASSIIKLLSEIAKDKLVIIVTHNYEQVSEYVTRKIKMHDGKIMEDKKIKDVSSEVVSGEANYKNIRFFSKLRLGIRNTFNIVPKFLLILIVFMFVIWAIMSEYASFKDLEYSETVTGYNYIFNDTSDTRLVIKKNDKTSFTEEDYDKINKLNNIKKLVKNDISIDTQVGVFHKDTWLSLSLKSMDTFDGIVDEGRVPENEYEAVIEGDSDSWYLSEMKEEILDQEFEYYSYTDNAIDKVKFKIVGIKYKDGLWNQIVYTSDAIINKVNRYIVEENSSMKVLFGGHYYNFQVVPSKKVPKGSVYITEDLNYMCKNGNCKKYKPSLRVEVNSQYFNDSLNLKVTNVYNKKTFTKMTGYKDYNALNGAIFINYEQFNSLFTKGNYQSSVYVEDVKTIDETVSELKALDLDVLKMTDTLVKEKATAIIQIFRTLVTIFLVVVLFFISYFVIKIILKSRNVYYTTIRMLGGNLTVSKELLLIELLNVANIAYVSFMLILYLNYKKVIQNEILDTMIYYLDCKDYIIMYVIIILMAALISFRFAKKLFKKSVMVTLSEEV